MWDAGMALGTSGEPFELFCVLLDSWVKKRKEKRTLMGGIPWELKIGMQKAEHRMLPKTRGRPHAGLALTQAEVWAVEGADWRQDGNRTQLWARNSSFWHKLPS